MSSTTARTTQREFLADHGQCLQQVFLRGRQTSIRAARIACTVGGIFNSPQRLDEFDTAPSRTSAPSSSSTCTVSSMKNGLPSVRSIMMRLSARISGPSPISAVSISSALSLPNGSSRNCV